MRLKTEEKTKLLSRRNRKTFEQKMRMKFNNCQQDIRSDITGVKNALIRSNLAFWAIPVSMTLYSNPLWILASPISAALSIASLPIAGVVAAKDIVKNVIKNIPDQEEEMKDDEKRIGYYASNLKTILPQSPNQLPVIPNNILAKISLFAASHPQKCPQLDPQQDSGPDFELAKDYVKEPEEFFLTLGKI